MQTLDEPAGVCAVSVEAEYRATVWICGIQVSFEAVSAQTTENTKESIRHTFKWQNCRIKTLCCASVRPLFFQRASVAEVSKWRCL